VRTLAIVLLGIVLAAAAACLPEPSLPIKVDMPGVSVFPAGLFREIVVTNFRDDAPSPEFAPGRELQVYLASEVERSFDGPVSLLTVSWEEARPSLEDPAFWKRAAAGHGRAVILTGVVRLSGQIRKALQKKALPIDGPFKVDDRGFIEYRHYSFSVDVAVLSSENGESLFRKSYFEEKDYSDLEIPYEFAFSDLAARLRASLFPVFLGTSTSEERTLLRR
jgi:hypothetical protein